jgi:hypothetical protein
VRLTLEMPLMFVQTMGLGSVIDGLFRAPIAADPDPLLKL